MTTLLDNPGKHGNVSPLRALLPRRSPLLRRALAIACTAALTGAGLAVAATPAVADPLGGSASGSDGAAVLPDGRWTFRAAGADVDPATGLGVVRYSGTVSVTTAPHLLTIAVADPWIEYADDGTWLSAKTSTDATVGADETTRVRMARLDLAPDAERDTAESVTGTFVAPLWQPGVLLPYSGQAIAPLDLRY